MTSKLAPANLNLKVLSNSAHRSIWLLAFRPMLSKLLTWPAIFIQTIVTTSSTSTRYLYIGPFTNNGGTFREIVSEELCYENKRPICKSIVWEPTPGELGPFLHWWFSSHKHTSSFHRILGSALSYIMIGFQNMATASHIVMEGFSQCVRTLSTASVCNILCINSDVLQCFNNDEFISMDKLHRKSKVAIDRSIPQMFSLWSNDGSAFWNKLREPKPYYRPASSKISVIMH